MRKSKFCGAFRAIAERGLVDSTRGADRGGVGIVDGFFRDVGDRGGRTSIFRGVARGEEEEDDTSAANGAEGAF